MHPELTRSLAAQRAAELHRLAGHRRLAAQCRRAEGRGSAASRLLARVRPGPAQAAARSGLPGVFTAGPEAFGVRTYLTSAEARQLAADWAGLLARFADRVDDPSCRPAGAVPFELVVLGRQVPDLVGAARGLPGPGQAS
jgi:sarcosine oxidase gamma subunit